MEITFTTPSGEKVPCEEPHPGAIYVTPKDISVVRTCSGCGHRLEVRCPSYTTSHDTMEGDAVCVHCNAPAGRLKVKVDTIFGIEEDRRVTNGRPRVY